MLLAGAGGGTHRRRCTTLACERAIGKFAGCSPPCHNWARSAAIAARCAFQVSIPDSADCAHAAHIALILLNLLPTAVRALQVNRVLFARQTRRCKTSIPVDFGREARIAIGIGRRFSSPTEHGSPRDLRGFGWCERQFRRRSPGSRKNKCAAVARDPP